MPVPTPTAAGFVTLVPALGVALVCHSKTVFAGLLFVVIVDKSIVDAGQILLFDETLKFGATVPELHTT